METLVLRPKTKKETNLFIEMAKAFNVPYERNTKEDTAGLKVPNGTTRNAIIEARSGKGKKIKTFNKLLTELKR